MGKRWDVESFRAQPLVRVMTPESETHDWRGQFEANFGGPTNGDPRRIADGSLISDTIDFISSAFYGTYGAGDT